MVEWEHDILFDIFTETVTIHGNYDSIGITLILIQNSISICCNYVYNNYNNAYIENNV